jgi:formylglycine-generating enzyme required for sulfatase activity
MEQRVGSCLLEASACAWAAILAGVAGGCGGEVIEPHGEAIIAVHTDMPVPGIVSAMRLDLYDENGWFESREIATPRAESWPLSFSVVSRHSDRDPRVLVRLRAYPSGRVRDYRGERFESALSYQEPWAPASMAQLCAEAEVIIPPATFDLRQGITESVTQPIETGDCTADQHAVTGVHVRIDQPGTYRFEVLGTYPALGSWVPIDSTLFLRTACDQPSSQIACNDNLAANGVPSWRLSRLEVHLERGDYTLFLGSSKSDLKHVDYRIRAARAEAWDEPDEPSLDDHPLPRLRIDGVDRTPFSEPEPALTIDRLFEVRLVHGVVRRYALVLRGECVGTMARLFESSPSQRVDFDEARTCVGTERESVPTHLAPVGDELIDRSVLGTFGLGTGCDREDDDVNVVCVPSGPLVFGDPRTAGRLPPRRTVPERVARMRRFWMDRYEVTVGDYRAALLAEPNLDVGDGPMANNFVMGRTTASIGDGRSGALCSWSDEPLQAPDGREDYALTCISWEAARAYCHFRGGDLPTEAQWEHAAASADRSREVTYPWEDIDPEPPTCERAWYGGFRDASSLEEDKAVWRELGMAYSGECRSDRGSGEPGFGPVHVAVREAHDVTPSGIVGMAGGVSEWVLDAAYPYDHACWRGASLDDPACTPVNAPARAVRGGSWVHGRPWLSSASRGFRVELPSADQRVPAAYLGFRCAYASPPSGYP